MAFERRLTGARPSRNNLVTRYLLLFGQQPPHGHQFGIMIRVLDEDLGDASLNSLLSNGRSHDDLGLGTHIQPSLHHYVIVRIQWYEEKKMKRPL